MLLPVSIIPQPQLTHNLFLPTFKVIERQRTNLQAEVEQDRQIRLTYPARILSRLLLNLNRRRARRYYRKNAARHNAPAKEQFRKHLGYEANLDVPRSHNEHILLRKLRDHDPRYPRLTDKYMARAWLDEVMGAGFADAYCVPLLASAVYFEDLPASLWSQDVILKASHMSGKNYVVRQGDTAAKEIAQRKLSRSLTKIYSWRRYEWAYLDPEPSIVAEPLLQDGNILDLKLYFYDGVLRFLMPEQNNGPKPALTVFDTDWKPLDMKWEAYVPFTGEPPPLLREMISLATQIAKGFDQLRVDFLITQERFYLGELTLYDASGLARFDSYESDLLLGQYWRQPHLRDDH
jgi:hypothetical protein